MVDAKMTFQEMCEQATETVTKCYENPDWKKILMDIDNIKMELRGL